MAYKRLGDVLIDAGLITEDQLGHALKQQKETKRRLGDELIAEGVITEAGLIEALQMQLGVPGHERSTELHGHRSGEERHSEARHPYGDHA